MRLGDTPVPIPNTMVKTQTADGTMLETVWKSRWVPEHFFYENNALPAMNPQELRFPGIDGW